MDKAQITGVILAGGQGQRMGGVDKGLQVHDGRSLVEHVLSRLAPQVGPLMINANRSQAEYARFGHLLLVDRIEGFAGPLAGLHAALIASTTEWVVIAPCDSPYLPLDLVARLGAALEDGGAPLAIARTEDRLHPVFCLCRKSLAPALESYLMAGGRKVAGWCMEMGARDVLFAEQPEAFRNFNYLDELAK